MIYLRTDSLISQLCFAALHQAAKETIALAEERFVNSRSENWQFDSAWQEMLNHATMKVCLSEWIKVYVLLNVLCLIHWESS